MAPVKKTHAPLQATFLAAWREHRKMNQDEAAAKIDVSRTLLSKMEQGKSPYSQRTLEGLARIYECEPADLLSRHPTKKAVDEKDVLALLRRIALIPEGDEWRAYGLLRNVWGEDAELPQQEHSRDQSQDASPHRGSARARRRPEPSDVLP